MGHVVGTGRFSGAPVVQPPPFNTRRRDVCRALAISESTLYRWERTGRIWAYDKEHPDGHYVVLVSGQRRYCMERLWKHIVR